MSQISRLHSTEIANGNLIDASHINNELNQLVNESNGQDIRISTSESSLSSLTTAIKNVISGLRPIYVNNNRVYIKPGICRDSSNTDNMEITVDLFVDLSTSGLNGLDTGSEAANTWYYLHVIKNPSTGIVGAVFSTSSNNPTMPSGYTKKRLLPIAFRNDGSSNLIPFYIAGGWPTQTRVYYTQTSDYSTAPLNLITASTNTSFTAKSLANLVPPISRQAILNTVATYVSAAGAINYRATGDTSNGWIVANAASASTLSVNHHEIQTDVNQSIDTKTSNAGTNYKSDVLGYVVTEL